MTGAELAKWRAGTGLEPRDLEILLNVDEQEVRRWEQGKDIPGRYARRLHYLGLQPPLTGENIRKYREDVLDLSREAMSAKLSGSLSEARLQAVEHGVRLLTPKEALALLELPKPPPIFNWDDIDTITSVYKGLTAAILKSIGFNAYQMSSVKNGMSPRIAKIIRELINAQKEVAPHPLPFRISSVPFRSPSHKQCS